MFSCCGLGRKKRKNGIKGGTNNDERTPLLDPASVLPFVPAPQPRVIDDEALLEYQRRIDRIIEEAAEKIINVTTEQPPFVDSGNSSSHTSPHDLSSTSPTPSTSSGPSTSTRIEPSRIDDSETIWRAEGHDQKPRDVDGSVYSLKKVGKASSSRGASRKGKGISTQDHAGSDHQGENTSQERNAVHLNGMNEEFDSGEETATEGGSSSRRSSSNAGGGVGTTTTQKAILAQQGSDGMDKSRKSSSIRKAKEADGDRSRKLSSSSTSSSIPAVAKQRASSQSLQDALTLSPSEFARLLTSGAQ